MNTKELSRNELQDQDQSIIKNRKKSHPYQLNI